MSSHSPEHVRGAITSVVVGVLVLLIFGAISISITTWKVSSVNATGLHELNQKLPGQYSRIESLSAKQAAIDLTVQYILEDRAKNLIVINKNTEVLASVDKTLGILAYSLENLTEQSKQTIQQLNQNTASLNRAGM